MATKKTGSKVDRKKVLAEIRASGSFRGSTDRKTLFIRPKKDSPLRCFVLPDMRERGTHGEKVPFLTIGSHWLTRTFSEKSFKGTITCIRCLREEEPMAYQYLLSKDLLKKNDDCIACILIDALEPSDLGPKDDYGKPEIMLKRSYNFQAIRQKIETDDEDPQKIKILPVNTFGMQSFMDQLYDEEEFSEKEFSDFQANGIFTTWRQKDQGRQEVAFDKSKKIWMQDWKEHLLELELAAPVLINFEDQIELMLDNLPKQDKIIRSIADGERPMRTPDEENGAGPRPRRPSRSQQKSKALKRVSSAK